MGIGVIVVAVVLVFAAVVLVLQRVEHHSRRRLREAERLERLTGRCRVCGGSGRTHEFVEGGFRTEVECIRCAGTGFAGTTTA